MAFCNKCGAEIPEGANVCPACGEPVKASAAQAAQNVAQNIMNTADTTAEFDPADIQQNKIISLFAYLGILFLIPLLARPDSKYARFHTNQGIVFFIVDLILTVIFSIISAIVTGIASATTSVTDVLTGNFGALGVASVIVTIIGLVISIPLLILMIMGIVNAVTGKAKELPIIGKFRILK